MQCSSTTAGASCAPTSATSRVRPAVPVRARNRPGAVGRRRAGPVGQRYLRPAAGAAEQARRSRTAFFQCLAPMGGEEDAEMQIGALLGLLSVNRERGNFEAARAAREDARRFVEAHLPPEHNAAAELAFSKAACWISRTTRSTTPRRSCSRCSRSSGYEPARDRPDRRAGGAGANVRC